jgi:hypothetical protein
MKKLLLYIFLPSQSFDKSLVELVCSLERFELEKVRRAPVPAVAILFLVRAERNGAKKLKLRVVMAVSHRVARCFLRPKN